MVCPWAAQACRTAQASWRLSAPSSGPAGWAAAAVLVAIAIPWIDERVDDKTAPLGPAGPFGGCKKGARVGGPAELPFYYMGYKFKLR